MQVQNTSAQRPVQQLPPSQHYHNYGSATSTQVPYNMPLAGVTPANRYPHGFDGGPVGGVSVPPTPHPEFSGYTGYPPPAPAQSSSYHQQHHTAYSPHPQSAMASPVRTDMAPGGYFDPRHADHPPSYPTSPYGHPTGPDTYMKHGVPPSSFSNLPYAPDPGTMSGNSMSNWQDQQTVPGQVQQPPPQTHYSPWQGHGYQQ